MVAPFDSCWLKMKWHAWCVTLVCRFSFYPVDLSLALYLPLVCFTWDSGLDVDQLTIPQDDWMTSRWVSLVAWWGFCR